MPEKYKGKYRIQSARLKNWDYGWNAMYFVTICTQNRKLFFGNIVKMRLIASQIGQIAKKYWVEIPQHFPFVELDEFVVMPNHIHGIIIIDKMDDGRGGIDERGEHGGIGGRDECAGRDVINHVSTTVNNSKMITKKQGGITGIKNPMLSDNLSKIIRWYKGRVSFESHKIQADFAWQPRFHDHIIRNNSSFQRIKNYIYENPAKWTDDKFYI